MREYIELPEKAYIKEYDWYELRVENHMVVSDISLLEWLLDVVMLDNWNKALSYLIQQGFKYDAVIKQCIEDLKDPKIVSRIMWWFGRYNQTFRDEEFATSDTGKKFKAEFTAKLEIWKDWDQFHREMYWDGDFYKNIKKTTLEADKL